MSLLPYRKRASSRIEAVRRNRTGPVSCGPRWSSVETWITHRMTWLRRIGSRLPAGASPASFLKTPHDCAIHRSRCDPASADLPPPCGSGNGPVRPRKRSGARAISRGRSDAHVCLDPASIGLLGSAPAGRPLRLSVSMGGRVHLFHYLIANYRRSLFLSSATARCSH